MQIFSLWAVKLFIACLSIDFDSWLTSWIIEPKCYISTSCIDNRSGLYMLNILLYKFSEIIDFSKQNDPTVIGCIMLANLS